MKTSRRNFFKLAALAGSTVAQADQAAAKTLYAYAIPPDDSVPGLATWYASVCAECPAGCGIRVRTREGRAVMIEGNPDHPVNQGGLCARGHAALQGLYNPDRLSQPAHLDADGKRQALSWDAALNAFMKGVQHCRESGKQVAFLGPKLGSLGELVDRWLASLGGGLRVIDQLPQEQAVQDGYRLAYGQEVEARFRLERARTVLSVGADFLETWGSPVEYTRGLTTMRRTYPAESLFVYAGTRRSLTAANADRFLSLRPGGEPWLLLGLLRLVVSELPADSGVAAERPVLERVFVNFSLEEMAAQAGLRVSDLRSLADRLRAHTPGLVLVGGSTLDGPDGAGTAALGASLNHMLGVTGQTVELFQPLPAPQTDLATLVAAMEKEEIGLLVIQEANPVFTTPAGLNFAQALRHVPLVVHLSSFPTETTELVHLTLPSLTPLERWNDQHIIGRGWGLAQPVMQPVVNGPRAPADILLDLWRQLAEEGPPAQSAAEYLRTRWLERLGITDPDDAVRTWAKALEQGGLYQDEPPLNLRLDSKLDLIRPRATSSAPGLALMAYPSSRLYDGRGANRPWLQELPDPMTKAVWGGWVELHPDTAQAAGIHAGERVRLRSALGEIELPAILTQDSHPDIVAVPLGYGHASFGRYADVPGANPLSLIDTALDRHTGTIRWAATRLEITGTGTFDPPVLPAGSRDQHGRQLARAVAPGAAARSPAEVRQLTTLRTFNVPHEHPQHRWGMLVDLDLCVGCNACVTACSAENNIPVVGRTEMARNHAQHWIRIDRYDAGTQAEPDTRFLPMFCQQCDQAPCETVCPVYATYHTPQGLNAMVYNRCIGTRYCENNCPYSVRSFNWFPPQWPAPLHLQLNPDVSVRSAGVSEKCTFCVQRIRETEETARLAGRPVQDGEIRPACVSTCPADALVFGDRKDAQSGVSQAADSERAYHVLEYLNTQPAVTYLAQIKRDDRSEA